MGNGNRQRDAHAAVQGMAAGEARVFRAPGRINIVGEHTDHNGGLVLPTTTNANTRVRIAARGDRRVRIRSVNFEAEAEFDLDDVAAEDNWVRYAAGVAAEIEAAGVRIPGADITVCSDLPIGGGLGSSASFSVALAVAFADVAAQPMELLAIARVCQRAEQRHAGVDCGIMDQLAVAACERGKAMMIDCSKPSWSNVPIPSDFAFVVIDCGFRHVLTDGKYNQRVDECRRALSGLQAQGADIRSLSEATPALLQSHEAQLDPQSLRRARHVVTENQRVMDAVDCLRDRHLRVLGQILDASHASLRDDFEASCDAIEELRGVISEINGVQGCRLMGAGFGGCVLALLQRDKVDGFVAEVRRRYRSADREPVWIHTVEPARPAGPEDAP